MSKEKTGNNFWDNVKNNLKKKQGALPWPLLDARASSQISSCGPQVCQCQACLFGSLVGLFCLWIDLCWHQCVPQLSGRHVVDLFCSLVGLFCLHNRSLLTPVRTSAFVHRALAPLIRKDLVHDTQVLFFFLCAPYSQHPRAWYAGSLLFCFFFLCAPLICKKLVHDMRVLLLTHTYAKINNMGHIW